MVFRDSRPSLWHGRAALLGGAMLLAACGGGGTSSTPPPPARPTPAPTPAPAPAPTPTPTPMASPVTFPSVPVPTLYNTAEFRRSDGPQQHNAHAAWASGTTGEGVTIAVVDTGIDVDSPEFAGRLSPKSTDIYPSRNVLDASDDHGTNVAMVAAAARDNQGALGIAWGSTIMAVRADQPGSCAGDNAEDPESECGFLDDAIANSIDYAAANGAKVINISLGGPEGITAPLRNAVNAAVNAGVLVVVAAGNDGFAYLEEFARQMVGAAPGGVLVVGSVDENYEISEFSNRAGTNQTYYLAARGETVCCVYEDGEMYVDDEGYIYLFSGTSFAAPQVSGAAALLAQAFPNLTGRQIADILLRTAFDVGAPGSDAVYGRGVLDINKALQPVGTTSLAGSEAAMPLGDALGTASPAMGDALSLAPALPAVVTDEYGRAFDTDLAPGLQGAQVANRLHDAVGSGQRHVSAAGERAAIAFSIDGRGERAPAAGLLRLDPEQAGQARVMAARVALQIAPGKALGFAYGQNADGLVQQLQGHERPAFMIARRAEGDDGMVRSTDAAFAYRQQAGDWGITLSAESGSNFSGALVRRAAQMRGQRAEHGVASAGVAVDRRFGDLETALGVSWLGEERTLLGAHFHEGFGLSGADSLFVDASAGWRLGGDWRLGASLRQGWSRARGGGLVAEGSALTSRAFALDVSRADLFAPGDMLSFRLAQPLRVESGRFNLTLPSSWSYDTLTARYAVHSLSLAPQGRELVGELAWRGRLLRGDAAASLFYRKDPGHYANLPDDQGLALRWSTGF